MNDYMKTIISAIKTWVVDKLPTKTSELINNSGFITVDDVPTKTSELINNSGFVTVDDVPTKTSELTNNSGFITVDDIPESVTSWHDLENRPFGYYQYTPAVENSAGFLAANLSVGDGPKGKYTTGVAPLGYK